MIKKRGEPTIFEHVLGAQNGGLREYFYLIFSAETQTV